MSYSPDTGSALDIAKTPINYVAIGQNYDCSKCSHQGIGHCSAQ